MFQLDPSVFGNIKSKADYDRQKAMLMAASKQRGQQTKLGDLQIAQAENALNEPKEYDTQQILAEAIKAGGVENLPPELQAQLQAADIAQRAKVSVDSLGNRITNQSYFDLMGSRPSQVLNQSPSAMNQGLRADSGNVAPNTFYASPQDLPFVDVASQPDLPMEDLPAELVDSTQMGLPASTPPNMEGLSPVTRERVMADYLADVRKYEMENAKLQMERQREFAKVKGQTDLINKTINALLDEEGNLKEAAESAVGGFMGLKGLQSRTFPVTLNQRKVQPYIEQLGGQAFLQAFESLKGGGPITDIEGQKATEAIARLSQTQDPDDFAKSLRDLREVARNAEKRVGGQKATQNDPLGLFQ